MQRVFERWGAFVERRPVGVLLVAIAFIAIGVAGMTRLTAANGVQQIFVSSSESYTRYEAMRALFPPSQMDAVLVISDPDLLTPERLEALRNLQFDLSLETGVNSVVSLFSARRAAARGDSFPPLVPDDIPSGDAFASLVGEIVAHPLVRNRLVSADGHTVLFNVQLDPDMTDGPSLRAAVDALRATAEADLAPHGLSARMTGAPVMRAELDEINAREQLMLSLAAFAVGGLVSLAYFRRLSFALMSGTAPAVTVVMTFGLLGWLDISLTIALQIVAPLVTVIAFNNAMHVLFAILRSPGDPHRQTSPVAHAIGEVGPASLMTSLTSALAFVALMITNSEVIRAFGALAAFGTVTAFVAVITIIPALAVLVSRLRVRAFVAPRPDNGRLGSFISAADRIAAPRAKSIAIFGGLLIVVFVLAQTTLRPRYLMSDNMPFGSDTRAAISTIDAAFGGSQPLRILARWPANDPRAEAAVVGHLGDLETRLGSYPAIGSVLSLATLSDWLAAARPETAGDLDALLDALPDAVGTLLIDREAGAALITAMVPDQSTAANRQLIGEIRAQLAQIAPTAPGFTFEVTGSVALTALETGRIIRSLQISLLAAIVVIIGLIGVTFRRLWPAAISILPNIFPIVAGGAYLAARGGEINFAGAIAMTVAFGLAVDDTIHMLYRFRRELARTGAVEPALRRTMAKIGPVLVVSSLVLIAGIAVLFLSEMPMNRDYAQLTIIIFVAALLGDLVLLPALIRVFRGRPPQAAPHDATAPR